MATLEDSNESSNFPSQSDAPSSSHSSPQERPPYMSNPPLSPIPAFPTFDPLTLPRNPRPSTSTNTSTSTETPPPVVDNANNLENEEEMFLKQMELARTLSLTSMPSSEHSSSALEQVPEGGDAVASGSSVAGPSVAAGVDVGMGKAVAGRKVVPLTEDERVQTCIYLLENLALEISKFSEDFNHGIDAFHPPTTRAVSEHLDRRALLRGVHTVTEFCRAIQTLSGDDSASSAPSSPSLSTAASRVPTQTSVRSEP
ncbi:hypothetical protein BDK51DRAFT_44631, partial [Blyttiomyces helicus]